MNPLLALRLSDIYAWSVDFFGLRKGDSFKVLYEELYVGDQFFDIGTIHSAVFRHAGKDYDAFRFIQDQIPQYWNEKGENLKKAFLKAPLSFTRISSGFSYARRHPVTRVVRPHTGIDYAAPTGTPVMSIGDGVVTQRAYTRGGGNQVKIRHNSTYTTAYLHLSRFAKGLSVGKRVRQGEVIGYVGSTGLSTGPHLDFRVWKNGSPINPLRMESPPADPLKEENKELFAASMQRAKQLRDSVISVQYLDTILLTIGLDASVVYAR
jgi:murein DD-endopeptidase MepM/ murein hydrolase activator NlpD